MASKSLKVSKTLGAGTSTGSRRVKKQIDLLVRGYAFVPAPRPPNVIGQPWNNLTAIDIDNISNKKYAVKDVGAVICSQTGLYREDGTTRTFINIEFRLLSISVWAEEAHVTLFPLDYTRHSAVAELSRVDGSWAKNQWARAGYTYPVSVSNVVLSSAVLPTLALFQIMTSATTRIEIHMKILWRSAESQFPSLRWVRTKVMKPGRDGRVEEDVPEDNAAGPDDDEEGRGMRLHDRCVSVSSAEDLTIEVDRLRAIVSRLQVDRPHVE